MTRDSLKTAIARIAALRTRGAYRQEKLRLLGELRDARQRGDDPVQFMAEQERAALLGELLGRPR